jgi:O-antigen/teichoic acid export membrane protein
MSNTTWKNFFLLLRGRGASAVLTLAATALMATALSVQDFGVVVLMHTYVVVVRGLLQFKPFEPIVRFGVPFLDAGNNRQLSSLLCLTRIVDVTSSALAAGLAILLVPVAANYLQWDSELADIAVLYSLVLLFTGTGTAKGVLRIYNRFDALSLQLIVAPVVRLSGVAIAALLEADRNAYMLAWALALVAGNSYMVLRGYGELRRHLSRSIWHGQRWKTVFEVPGDFWHFSAIVYAQTQVDLVTKHINTLLVGVLLGPGAAGLFRVAKDFANILATPAVLLRQVLFPDLTRAWHKGEANLKRNAYRIAVTAGLGGALLVALSLPFGAYLLSLIGAEYAQADTLLSLLLVGAALVLAGAPLRTAAYAIGKAGSVLKINLLCMGLYVVMFFIFATTWGLSGPGIAGIISSSCALLGMLYVVAKSSKKRPG